MLSTERFGPQTPPVKPWSMRKATTATFRLGSCSCLSWASLCSSRGLFVANFVSSSSSAASISIGASANARKLLIFLCSPVRCRRILLALLSKCSAECSAQELDGASVPRLSVSGVGGKLMLGLGATERPMSTTRLMLALMLVSILRRSVRGVGGKLMLGLGVTERPMPMSNLGVRGLLMPCACPSLQPAPPGGHQRQRQRRN
mmetsp:Transcript_109602/g.353674  ORF Transcript_109602/g.353674 Transcript_109602/m.353674 type:complete len:203 (-) Transcript_109602:333-941(-)